MSSARPIFYNRVFAQVEALQVAFVRFLFLRDELKNSLFGGADVVNGASRIKGRVLHSGPVAGVCCSSSL